MVQPDFALDDVTCNGDEESLYDCHHREHHNCGKSEAAGVICQGWIRIGLEILLNLKITGKIRDHDHDDHDHEHDEDNHKHDEAKIELKGGSSPIEGNVFVNGKPVCDDLWDDDDATVACRMLGYYFILIDNHNFLYEGFPPAPTQSDPGLALCQRTTSWTM